MAGNSNNRKRTEQKRSKGKYQVDNIGKAIANQLTLLQNLILWHFKRDVKGRNSKTPNVLLKRQDRIQSMSNEGRCNRRCYSCLFFGHIARNCPRINKGRADRHFIETGFWRDAQAKNEGQPQRINQENNWRGSRLGQNIQRNSNTQEISVALEQRPQVCRTNINKCQPQKSPTMKDETDHRSKAKDNHPNKQESSVKELGKEDDGSKLQVIATQNNQVTSKEVKTEADDDSEKVKENNRELLKVNKKVKADLVKTGKKLAARKMEQVKEKYEQQLKGVTEEISGLNEKIKSLAQGKGKEIYKLQTMLKVTQDQMDTVVEAVKVRNKELIDENARLTQMINNLKTKGKNEEKETAKSNQKINHLEEKIIDLNKQAEMAKCKQEEERRFLLKQVEESKECARKLQEEIRDLKETKQKAEEEDRQICPFTEDGNKSRNIQQKNSEAQVSKAQITESQAEEKESNTNRFVEQVDVKLRSENMEKLINKVNDLERINETVKQEAEAKAQEIVELRNRFEQLDKEKTTVTETLEQEAKKQEEIIQNLKQMITQLEKRTEKQKEEVNENCSKCERINSEHDDSLKLISEKNTKIAELEKIVEDQREELEDGKMEIRMCDGELKEDRKALEEKNRLIAEFMDKLRHLKDENAGIAQIVIYLRNRFFELSPKKSATQAGRHRPKEMLDPQDETDRWMQRVLDGHTDVKQWSTEKCNQILMNMIKEKGGVLEKILKESQKEVLTSLEENIDNNKDKEIRIKLRNQTKELNKIKEENESMRQRLEDSIGWANYLEKRNKILQINVEALAMEKEAFQQQTNIKPDIEM